MNASGENRLKVNEAVSQVIDGNYVYQLLISTGLVNANALAREIKESVEAMTGKKAKINTIAKAIAMKKVSEVETSSVFRGLNFTLDSNLIEKELDAKDATSIPLASTLLLFRHGDKVVVLKQRDENDESSDLVLLRLTFPGNSVAYHPLWIVFNSLNIEVKHVLRHDNDLFIFMRRSEAIRALTIIERLASNLRAEKQA
ncbi:hypothetical protein PQ610_06130 [Tardisphaera miroshnichenkoae]